jgi:hypothetical protein
MCADAGVVNSLAFIDAVLNKLFGTKRCTVGMVVFYTMATFFGVSFEIIFRFECFPDSEGHLITTVYVLRHMVNEQGAPRIFLGLGFLTLSVRKPSMCC